MSPTPFFLVVVTFEDVVKSWQSLRPSSFTGFLVFAAIGLVTLLVVLWAVYIRKPGRRRSRHHSHHHTSVAAQPAGGQGDAHAVTPQGRRHRRRRSRRKHRPRNPTLAETGGLPSIRPNGPTAP